MTTIVKLVNAGNHPDDLVTVTYEVEDVSSGIQTQTQLRRGEIMYVSQNRPLVVKTDYHGGGDECRAHDAMAVMVEGPGKERVRADFNPSELDTVARLKKMIAAAINEIDALEADGRLKALAMTSLEEGAMWAVKAATGPKQ